MRSILIGLCGYGRVGKTTTALAVRDIISNEGEVTILPFAEPLKDLARYYFGWDGTKDERGRRLLQSLGTEVGRNWDPEFWVKKWTASATEIMSRGAAIISDDVRFDNEASAIKALGGVVVRLSHGTRGSEAASFAHASERPDDINHDIMIYMEDKTPSEVAREIIIEALKLG
jgi:hypothetical protein